MPELSNTAAFFSTLALFRGLSPDELEDVAGSVRDYACEAGRTIFRQGDASDGMYVVREGTMEIRARVPGDEEIPLAELGPGALLGEIALLDGGLRTATATAVTDVQGYWFGRRHFDILRLDRKSASLALMRRLIDSTCASVRRSFSRIADLLDELEALDRSRPVSAEWKECGRDRLHLEALPFFRELDREELERVIHTGRVLRGQRGAVLHTQGQRSDRIFIVLRGATRTLLERGSTSFQISVDPPGSVVGLVASLDGEPHPTHGEACEDTVVLELSLDAMRELATSSWHFGARMHDELVRTMRLCTDHAARLVLERHLGAPGGSDHV